MLTYYCPDCWQIVDEKDEICPYCGYPLIEFSRQDYYQKLLDALHHIIPERRIIAAQILGNLKIQEAVPVFKEILASEIEDYYFLRAVLLALAKIEHPEQLEILEKAAHHRSSLVRAFAIHLLEKIKNNETIESWDNFSG